MIQTFEQLLRNIHGQCYYIAPRRPSTLGSSQLHSGTGNCKTLKDVVGHVPVVRHL